MSALPSGRLPAPPHDATGHTWHHSDKQLFDLTRNGVANTLPGYESDMPAFKGVISDDEIWAVLAYIKSTWPPDIRERQARISHPGRFPNIAYVIEATLHRMSSFEASNASQRLSAHTGCFSAALSTGSFRRRLPVAA